MATAADRQASERRRSALPGSPYDLFVRGAKIVLPLAALAVLLVTLIWPLTAQREFSFVLDKNKVSTSEERLRLERPMYRGTDRRGQPFEISADHAVQKSSSEPVVMLTGLNAQLDMAEGLARVTAPSGRYDLTAEKLNVDGPVRFARPDGFALETANVVVDLPSRRVTSTDAVTGRMPLGTFRAARLSADIAGRRVLLDGGAHLRIEPRSAK